ncbi:hypothetical protein THL1_4972 [Pseudomonas sp. TCU-HL1]|nr:hypothetical protein THL1_4972 [Pseudomonas sp. TCU-HL1]
MNLTSSLLAGAFPGYEVSLASRPDGRVLMTLMRPGAGPSCKVIDAQALSSPVIAAKVIRQVARDLKLNDGSPDVRWLSLELPTYHDEPLRQPTHRTWTGSAP